MASLDFKRPSGQPASGGSEKLTMAMLGGEDEDMDVGEDQGAADEEDDLGYFSEEEAMKKLEQLGYIVQPPESDEPEEEEDDMGEGVSEPVDINGMA